MPGPRKGWRMPYERLAKRDRLPWLDLDHLHANVAAFLDPVLGGVHGVWSPKRWSWTPTSPDEEASE